jgi:anti-anti-sigma regulatory factor
MSSDGESTWSCERRQDQLVCGGKITDETAGLFAAALQTAGVDGVVTINMAGVKALSPSGAIALQRAAGYWHEQGEQFVLVEASAEVLQTLGVLGLTERPFFQVKLRNVNGTPLTDTALVETAVVSGAQPHPEPATGTATLEETAAA